MSKNVLEKVSFDKNLFQKELHKALRWLKKEDAHQLKIWAMASFAMYTDVIREVFIEVVH